jgi:DUF2975 family protein
MSAVKVLNGGIRVRRIQIGAMATKWALTLCALAVLLFWLEDILSILFPTHPFFMDVSTLEIGETERPLAEMSLNQRLPLVALTTVSYALLTGVTLAVRTVCRRFQSADFFSRKTLDTVFSIGVGFITYAVFNIMAFPVATYIATLDYPENKRVIDVAIGGDELFSLILGALMLLLGCVMREAALLAEENQQII